eukprot:356921-Chlamydomonas_euryale.AAC.2
MEACVRRRVYEASVWRHVCGGVRVEACVWRRVCGGVCMEACVWRRVCGGVCVEACVWRRVCGGVCMEACVCRRVRGGVCVEAWQADRSNDVAFAGRLCGGTSGQTVASTWPPALRPRMCRCT